MTDSTSQYDNNDESFTIYSQIMNFLSVLNCMKLLKWVVSIYYRNSRYLYFLELAIYESIIDGKSFRYKFTYKHVVYDQPKDMSNRLK